MGEKMLITQALTEKETLQDEICRLIQESKFCFADTICEREEKTQQRKLNETEFSRNAQELFEKIQEKIKRYYQIEEAIIVSNAKVKIHTQVGDFTVAGAVSLRNRLRGKSTYQNSLFEVNMERKMDQEYTRSVQQIKNIFFIRSYHIHKRNFSNFICNLFCQQISLIQCLCHKDLSCHDDTSFYLTYSPDFCLYYIRFQQPCH